ncbi:hypothetical protein C7441_112147 [Pseudaminobacter salicylatoxidans]|uniref:Uncharacterized protein n=1 Tax=Pseudaminobacter salicylatoxidans TaxID=93369 RepID=A0A316BZT1_PSESE|nr:hypothetical protein [Pseudaminobacter salicylatoxidans]PWJ80605.1 hypothetical protein C7441_112147 [Pseudaminobacter salicylatoxidans]
MRLKLHREVSVSAQLELPLWSARPRHDNDDDPFASSLGLPERRVLTRMEAQRVAELERRLTTRSLTLADCYARSGPSGTEGYEQ